MQYLLQHSPAVTRRWWLTVAPDNQVAVQLYQKLGFVSERYYADYYGPGEHRLLLARQ
jgi:ribosomal protein S18 acetylase RimI-like enzyme